MREFKLWHVSKDPRGLGDLSRAGGLHGCSGISPQWWWHNFLSLPLAGSKMTQSPEEQSVTSDLATQTCPTCIIPAVHPCSLLSTSLHWDTARSFKGMLPGSQRRVSSLPPPCASPWQGGCGGGQRSRSHQAVQQTWRWLFPAAEPGVPKSPGAPSAARCKHAPVPAGCTSITNIPPGRRVSGQSGTCPTCTTRRGPTTGSRSPRLPL